MEKQVRIALIGPSHRFVSGISYFTARLSDALSCEHDVLPLLFRYMLPRRLFPGWKRVGTGISRLTYGKDVRAKEMIDWYNPVSWIAAAWLAVGCDLIILEWWTASVAHMYSAIQLFSLRRRPFVIEFHEVIDPLEHSKPLIRLYSRIMAAVVRRLATGYIAHSEADRELISSHFGIAADRIAVIPHGLYDHYPVLQQEEAKRVLGIHEDHVILFFGLIRPYKGVKDLIRAFELLNPAVLERSRLLIVGETWEDYEAAELARVSRAAERITWIDRYVSDDEIPVIFSASGLLVLPYRRASQSGVAHIGMSYGIPIIGTRVGGLAESLGRYKGARFVDPDTPVALASAIEGALKEWGPYLPPPELGWGKIATDYREYFRALLAGERTG
jgi:glycosyltransferase involved in cell wall biosynthesis